MNNQIQVFNNEEFGEIRTLCEGERVLFCGSDVAKALGYAAPRNAISARCKGALKRCALTNGGEQEKLFLPDARFFRSSIRFFLTWSISTSFT